MKETVLDTKAIPQLPEIKKEMKEDDKIVISNYAWNKWPVEKGYLLEMDRLVKELILEGKLSIGSMEFTYEEFLEWCDEDTWAEWINGQVLRLSPASRRHQQLAHFLQTVIGIFVERKNSGTIISAPFQMKTGSNLPGREPDLLFISKERESLLKESHLQGPADLVIEIVSPESRSRDGEEKFAEYEKGGVKEYWIIDPDLEKADFYLQDEQGRFREQDLDNLGFYHPQALPGFKLKVEWLWQDPLPPTLEVLRELSLV